MSYEKINWQDHFTALSAENLGHMDNQIALNAQASSNHKSLLDDLQKSSNVLANAMYTDFLQITELSGIMSGEGHIKLPIRIGNSTEVFVMQWGGSEVVPNTPSFSVVFPETFQNRCLKMFCTTAYAGIGSNQTAQALPEYAGSNAYSIEMRLIDNKTGFAPTTETRIDWLAIGY